LRTSCTADHIRAYIWLL